MFVPRASSRTHQGSWAGGHELRRDASDYVEPESSDEVGRGDGVAGEDQLRFDRQKVGVEQPGRSELWAVREEMLGELGLNGAWVEAEMRRRDVDPAVRSAGHVDPVDPVDPRQLDSSTGVFGRTDATTGCRVRTSSAISASSSRPLVGTALAGVFRRFSAEGLLPSSVFQADAGPIGKLVSGSRGQSGASWALGFEVIPLGLSSR